MDVHPGKSQKKRQAPTEDAVLEVIGKVKKPVLLGINELRALEMEDIIDIPLICGTGDPKGIIASCRGVLMENVIRLAEVIREEHNDTKKMFIVASSDDGYKVVFSWQEIFNTPIGGGVMIVLEKDGKPLGREGGWCDLISAQDYFTGSRYVKGLRSIEVLLAG